MAAPFVYEFRVRWGECDPQGIVFNANYVAYFDHLITELWRELFGSYQVMGERGVDMVTAELNVTYRGSARFDELVQATATIENLGTTSMTTRMELLRDGESLVQCRVRHVFVDATTWEKTAMPSWLRDGLSRYLETPADVA
jgi:acyl-CoA thioester hydrolase